ncbi:tRNA(Ile)-lysidine synthase [Nitrospira sp.]|nr:tRNA(Ile)-lysidine synthase [Nitrospira sp.]
MLIAVSGGPDSVALLHTLHHLAPAWRLSLAVVHCNYGLRGRASLADEAFVRDVCRRLDVPCHGRRIVLGSQRSHGSGQSVQARARTARYRLFDELADRHGFDRVALGHTADDQAETILQWMVRGAGTTGLSGMPIMRNDRFIRPLLTVTKAEVLSFLHAHRLPFRTDRSNDRPLYRRNRIRLEVLPVLRKLNPSIVKTLARQADLIRADENYLTTQSKALRQSLVRYGETGEAIVDRTGLLCQSLALQRRIVRDLVMEFQGSGQPPSSSTVTSLLDRMTRSEAGTTFERCGLAVTREYDRIVFIRTASAAPRLRSPAHPSIGRETAGTKPVHVSASHPSRVLWPLSELTVQLRIQSAAKEPSSSTAPHLDRVLFDADRITPTLRLRAWEPGDWFCPAGMGGHRKKLQDFWTDAKVPRRARSTTPLLVAPEGILWIVGLRADERFRANERTRRILIAEVTRT